MHSSASGQLIFWPKFGAGDGGEWAGVPAQLPCLCCAAAGAGLCRGWPWQSAALAADWLPPPRFPQRQGNLLRISGWKIHPSRRQQERRCRSSRSPSLPPRLVQVGGGSLPPLTPQTARKRRCQPQTCSCFLWFVATRGYTVSKRLGTLRFYPAACDDGRKCRGWLGFLAAAPLSGFLCGMRQGDFKGLSTEPAHDPGEFSYCL